MQFQADAEDIPDDDPTASAGYVSRPGLLVLQVVIEKAAHKVAKVVTQPKPAILVSNRSGVREVRID